MNKKEETGIAGLFFFVFVTFSVRTFLVKLHRPPFIYIHDFISESSISFLL